MTSAFATIRLMISSACNVAPMDVRRAMARLPHRAVGGGVVHHSKSRSAEGRYGSKPAPLLIAGMSPAAKSRHGSRDRSLTQAGHNANTHFRT
jgi:hypothetical protein